MIKLADMMIAVYLLLARVIRSSQLAYQGLPSVLPCILHILHAEVYGTDWQRTELQKGCASFRWLLFSQQVNLMLA